MRFDTSIYFPQWQGGPNQGRVAEGGRFLHKRLKAEIPFHLIPADLSESAPRNHIWHYEAIRSNLQSAVDFLRQKKPKTLFTLGGDCSVDVAGIDYLNSAYGEHFGLVWIDAHADINTPQTSPSQFFHGMPLRTLMGEGEANLCALLQSKLQPSQVCYAGIRSIDPGERDYIDTNRMAVLDSEDINKGRYDRFLQWRAQNDIRHLHIHFDLDALDPADDISVTYHIPGGIGYEAMQRFLAFLHGQNITVGFTLTEYAPPAYSSREIERILELAAAILPLKKSLAA